MKALGQAQFPVVSANLFRPAADGALVPLVQTSVILQRQLRTGLGQIAALRIGVTGAAPPQTAQWDRQVLAGGLHSGDIPHAIAPQVAALRRAGADLVVVLCHSGLGAVTAAPEAEHAARTVAAIPGVDAVIAGHSHDAYPKQPGPPDPSHAPIVMPGHEGSHLGLIDLHLLPRPGGGWAVRPVHTEALATSTARPRGSDARISALVRRDQAAARPARPNRGPDRTASAQPLCAAGAGPHCPPVGRGLRPACPQRPCRPPRGRLARSRGGAGIWGTSGRAGTGSAAGQYQTGGFAAHLSLSQHRRCLSHHWRGPARLAGTCSRGLLHGPSRHPQPAAFTPGTATLHLRSD